MAYSGKYRPISPQKYKGNPTEIYYRSLWELRFMKWCDENKKVLEWGSEEIVVPYRSPLDGKYHRYFVDFYIN
jgi:trans-aconitate methyltransferase